MEDFGDDFGDLYAGVEAQAYSAINGVPGFAQFYTEPEDVNDDNDKDSKKPDSLSDELGEKVSGLEANEDYNGSDSEDDLKIVLNEEDCEGPMFPVAGRGCMKIDEDEDDDNYVATKDYKYVRTQGSTCPISGNANEAVGFVSSMLVRGDHDNTISNQRNGSSSQITYVRDTPNRLVAQNRYGFRLPWYRTILDVNIESFEEKPWRYPGVDITDYFNFGFNEDSWKQYCNSLEQLRRASMQFGIPVSDYSKFNQAKEAGSEYDKFAQETIFKEMNCAGSRKVAPPSSRVSDSRPKGRAIQIEDSIVERQPSFDRWHPRCLDSDVVIQITGQDLTEENSNSGEEQRHRNGTAHEASEIGEFDTNGNRIIPSCDNAKEDALSVGTLERNARRLDRCSQQISSSHPMTKDSDKHGNNQVVDLDGYDHKELNAISSETIELANTTKESVGRNTFYADQCMMEPQLSLGDDDELSPTSFCFESDSESSTKSVHFDPEDTHTPVRSSINPQTELFESVTSSFKNSKGNGIKRKLVDIKDYSTLKSLARKECKHHDRRLESVVEPNIRTKDDNDASPTSGTEDLCDRDHTLNSCRRKKKQRDFGRCDRKNVSDYKESSYNGIRYANHRVHRAKENYLNRKGVHDFHGKLDPSVRKNGNEREYFYGDRDTNRHHFGRPQFTKERSPLTSRGSRGLHSRYSSDTVEERDAQFRRNRNKLQFKKIPDSGGSSDYKHEEDFVGKIFGRSVSFNDHKRNTFDEFDERQFPQVRRELKNSRGRGICVDSPVFYWDDSFSGKTEDEYCRHGENRYLSHQSYRELYIDDERRWNDSLSPRNDVSDSTRDERYWRNARETYSPEAKECNWFDSCGDADEIDDIIYRDDHLRWRRSNWRSEVVHWTEDQLTVRDHGEKLYSEKASYSYKKYVRHEKLHAKYGSSHDAMHIDDMLSEQQRLKMMRKGGNANCINRSSKMYKGKHEQTTLRCRDSIDLVVGERKSSGRCSKGRTLMWNSRLENMDPRIGENRTTLVDSSESEKVRAVQFNTQKAGCNQNNDDLGIEEGQIVTVELNTAHPLQRKHASEHAAPAHNVRKRMLDSQSVSNGNKAVEGYDNQRILETMAKMEKRGERFKEPITLKKEPDKLSKPEVDLLVKPAETQQDRPARKRQWRGIEVV